MRKSFLVNFAGRHLATSLRINFFADNFHGFWLNEHFPMATSCSYTRCLKNPCEIVIAYAGWNTATYTWSHKKRRDSLKGSQDRVLYAAEPEFPKRLVYKLS